MFIVSLKWEIFFALIHDFLLMYAVVSALSFMQIVQTPHNLLFAFIYLPHQYSIPFHPHFDVFYPTNVFAPHSCLETNLSHQSKHSPL